MKIHGNWDKENWYGEVTVDGKPLLPENSLKVRNHSPDGFSWGYAGSGPAQLALGILLAAGIRPPTALEYYQEFKREFLVDVKSLGPLDLEVDPVAWLERKRT